MKQLSLFDFEPKVKRPTPRMAPIPTPEEVGDCLEILGVRYSLAPVQGWCAVRNLSVARGCPKYPVVPPDQVVWADPRTIWSVYTNGMGVDSNGYDWGIFWGWGLWYSVVEKKQLKPSLSHLYPGKKEAVRFDFVDRDSWQLAEQVKRYEAVALNRLEVERNRHRWTKWLLDSKEAER